MNAPATITPARDRYIPIVRHHMPMAEGEELRARCSILLLRDLATSKLRACGDEAIGPLETIERLATLHAHRAMPIEDLKRLQYCLVRLIACASDLNIFAFNLSSGESHEGG